jgi:hypothetical protein
MDGNNPKYIGYSIRPHSHQPTGVSNTAYLSGPLSAVDFLFETKKLTFRHGFCATYTPQC